MILRIVRYKQLVKTLIASILFLSVCGCSKGEGNHSYGFDRKTLTELSVSARKDDTLDFISLEKSIPMWFSTEKNQIAFFQGVSAGEGVPANHQDVSLLIRNFIYRSLIFAKKGNREESRKSLLIAARISQQVTSMNYPAVFNDVDGTAISKKDVYLRLMQSHFSTITDMNQYLNLFPATAKKWDWFSKVQPAVAKAKTANRPIVKEVLAQLKGKNPDEPQQWADLYSSFKQNLSSTIGNIVRTLESNK